ncbi:MAG TPA: hypothetical protein VGU71_15580 [Candidatus Dormibacteraeota bacterium]|nr:hypothetical protein [Candidatus Dormibacteraeota bacterium]
MAALVENPNPGLQAAGQISADGQFRWDGQQWVPLASGHREPTPWTRPMQLAAAGLCALQAVTGVILTLIFINHDSMLAAIKAQGTTIPSGTSVDDIVNIAVASTVGVVIFFAVLELVGAVGSYLGWRWVFWAVLVLFALGGLGALTNLSSLFQPSKSPFPIAGVVINELLSVASLAVFVWMLMGLIKFGPWAMRKPG